MPELRDKPFLFERIKQECIPFSNIPPQEDEFLLTDYIAASGLNISRSTAERKLRDLEEQGIVTKRKGNYNGRSVNVYRFKE